jgi:hypothetical protein
VKDLFIAFGKWIVFFIVLSISIGIVILPSIIMMITKIVYFLYGYLFTIPMWGIFIGANFKRFIDFLNK